MADNANVSLPSIHELFPDHMLRVSPEIRVKGSAPPTLIPSHPYVPPQPLRKPSPQATRSHPEALPSLLHLQSSDSDEDESKKHICTFCKKRFRRPSSLNIHINTHTGATPYRCSLPGCGKEFNVKSNMLRHYRSHTNPVATQSSSSRYDSPTANPYPNIPSLSATSFAVEGQDQARGQVQSHPSRSWHDGAQMERERHYQRRYSVSNTRSQRDEDERDKEMDASRSYARHN
ncbi:uncharacterized protein EV420DRAFT_1138235 [Desarmillaria tabescens]|uniref:C2H2-type domain-containing protein n=1 Tax=Armillaria tabescens TaxID=1929756 RepID=A0AA39JGE8_ARMTA|nr:uncharacterized protein EV420DRAFT_1138235 [Desarmillaria tabescens]KAK0440038.1 hypothetical protein EV420DRAFT_1138235 [Desarmillaria tabescens]